MTESDLLDALKAKRVFLLEPPCRRKYLPLGLAKVASYVKAHGGRVQFGREYRGQECSLICSTSLFTTDLDRTCQTIEETVFLARKRPVIVGGVAASLMPGRIRALGAQVFEGYSQALDMCVPDYSGITIRHDFWCSSVRIDEFNYDVRCSNSRRLGIRNVQSVYCRL